MTGEKEAVQPLKLWQRRFWSQRNDYARLERELALFRIDLELLQTRTMDGVSAAASGADQYRVEHPGPQGFADVPTHAWTNAANDAADNAEMYLRKRLNIEGGWTSLHAARRHAVLGLKPGELVIQASMLRAEAKDKVPGWRGKEMAELLPENSSWLTAHHVVAAMALRDEHFSNQYHKIWLVGSQITILLSCCGVGFLFLLPLIVCSSRQYPVTLAPWGYQMVGAVLFFGLLGAAFSAAGSLMSANATAKIPERVANQFVTIARALFGSGVALAGYALYQSKALNLRFGEDTLPGSALAVAFLFGFGGEVLIARILGSLSGGKHEIGK